MTRLALEEFADKFQEAGLLPAGEYNDGLILAESRTA